MLRALAPAGLLSCCMLQGCAIVRPELRAAGCAIAERGPQTAQVDITLELSNPGDTEVELVNYDYLLTLEDGSSYGGRWAALRALPPRQTVQAVVPAIVPAASARPGTRWSVRGTASYRDPQSFARILYEAGILRTEASFSGDGEVAAASRTAASATE
ncbi:MAG: hypothetical protein RL136_639 [Planctomycetota bacterium]|jgi:hypothetical protein